jgi:hypothetical protein
VCARRDARNTHKSILQINLVETAGRDDLMRTGTYLISALILNYLMARPVGPGVRQMSTVIKFYFSERAVVGTRGWIYDFLTFINSQRLALTGSVRGRITGRYALLPGRAGPFIICTDNPQTALYYQL